MSLQQPPPANRQSLGKRDPDTLEALMPLWEWFYNNYFRVETDGWHHIPDRPVLFVGSHNGGLATPDLPMFIYDWVHRFGTQRPVYGLTHPKVWTAFPLLADVAARCGAIQAHPKIAMGAFQSGASVLVYPGGGQDAFRPHWQRQRIHFAGRRGFIKLALRERVPIVPLISWGAHDTLWVLEDCYDQAQRLHRHGMPWLMGIDPEVFPIYLGLPWGIGMGPLPNIPFPTQIHTRVCAPIYFERDGAEATKDKFYVEACAQRVITQMQAALNELATQVEGHQTGQPPLGNQIKPHV